MMLRLTKGIPLGLFVGLLGLLISYFPFVHSVEENKGLALLFAVRGAMQPPSDVVVVSIERGSSEKLNLPDSPDKWPRSIHARLTGNLTRLGASVIAFDLHFIEPRSTEGDKEFAESMVKADNVILTEPLKAKEVRVAGSDGLQVGIHRIVRTLKPIPLFSGAAVATAPFPLPRIPFKVNRYWTFQPGAGDSPTLPVMVFQHFTLPVYNEFVRLLKKVSPELSRSIPGEGKEALKKEGLKALMESIRGVFQQDPSIAKRMFSELRRSKGGYSSDREYRFLQALIQLYSKPAGQYLNYYGPPRTITTIPYDQALKIGTGKSAGKTSEMKGKAVFVGLSEEMLADRKDSFYTVFSEADGLFISGVEIAATAFSNLLESAPVQPLRPIFHFLFLLFWGIVMGIVCRLFKLKLGALLVGGIGILYLASAVFAFKIRNSWYPVTIPLFFQCPIAYLGAVAVEHSKLFKEVLIKLRMEEDLSAAREVQLGMLPTVCPTLEGYEIAASSTQAREVGGDFFDFIEMPEEKVGFVVGDVTGKSVSGAIVMSAARSVFRMLAEKELTVAELMNQANRRTGRDISKEMSVALLYAVLDPQKRTLMFCSAGQTQPILFSSLTGNAVFLDTEGDNFPLGILEDLDYEETGVRLAPGDRVVLYTDGIVEAMNPNKEIFGFGRLLEVVNENGYEGAEALKRKILQRVSAFVSGAEQHDDMTVIVVSVSE